MSKIDFDDERIWIDFEENLFKYDGIFGNEVVYGIFQIIYFKKSEIGVLDKIIKRKVVFVKNGEDLSSFSRGISFFFVSDLMMKFFFFLKFKLKFGLFLGNELKLYVS